MLTFQQMGGCALLDINQTCALNILTQKLLPNKPVIFESAAQGETLMTTGQVWVELNSDGRVWDMVQEGIPGAGRDPAGGQLVDIHLHHGDLQRSPRMDRALHQLQA